MGEKISDSWQTPADLFEVLDKGGIYQGIEFAGFNFDIDLCATKDNSKCDIYCIDYLNNKYQEVQEPFLVPGDLIFSDEDASKYGEAAYNKDVTCFMNPPYSNPKPFIEKAWDDSKHCKIVCLVKCDPSTRWWGTFWEYSHNTECWTCGYKVNGGVGYNQDLDDPATDEVDHCPDCNNMLYKVNYNGPKLGCKVMFLPKRIKYEPSPGWTKHKVVTCGGKVVKELVKLSGPKFSSALLVFDRRGQ